MISKLSAFFAFIFIFGFFQFVEAKGRFDQDFIDNACSEDPNSRNCQSAKAMYGQKPPAPAPTPAPKSNSSSTFSTIKSCANDPTNPKCKGPGIAAAAAATMLIKGKDSSKNPGSGKSTSALPTAAQLNQQLNDMCAKDPSLCKVPKSSKQPSAAAAKHVDKCVSNPSAPGCKIPKAVVTPKGGKAPPESYASGFVEQPAPVNVGTPKVITRPGAIETIVKKREPVVKTQPQPVSEADQVNSIPVESYTPTQVVKEPSSINTPAQNISDQSPTSEPQLITAPPASAQPQQPQQQVQGDLCNSNFDFTFPEGQSQYNEWQKAATNHNSAQCNLVGTSPYRVCCQGDPGIDYNRMAEQQPEGKTQESEQATQQNPAETAEPLTEKEKQYCQAAEENIYNCQNEFAPAERNCDPEDGSIGQWTRSMQITADGLRAISQTSIQAACSGMVTMAGGMNAALTTFETMCQSSRESCVSSCRKAKASIDKCPTSYKGYAALEKAIDMLDENVKQCQSYGSRVDSARNNANGVMQAIQSSQQCAAYTKAMNQPTLCQRDPMAPGCAGLGPQNCDNPAFAASNTVCICLRSPRDPRCQSSASQGATGFGAIAGGGGVPNLPGLNGSMGENAGGGGPTGADFASLAAGGSAAGAGAPGEDPGGKKGSGAALNPNGGGGNGNGSAGGGGGGYERNAQQVYNGNWGSGGRGGGFALGSRSGGSGSGGSNGYYRNPATADFNQFRPHGKMNKFSPGLSGLTGPDGLTGPNSGTIWQKVRNRYQAKSYSLKQRP